MNYLLDTNVISELIKKQPHPQVVAWLDKQDPARVYLNVITIGEIRKGIERLAPSAQKESLQAWLHTDLLVRFAGRLLELTTGVMLRWGELTGRLETEGIVLSAMDSLIAASALHGNCSLVTRNEDDFRGTGLVIINPWTEG